MMVFIVLILFFTAVKIDTTFGAYCSYSATRFVHTTKRCGVFGWGRCYYNRPSQYIYQDCCHGWTGSQCSIPVCSKPCGNGGTCIGPDQCKCPTTFTGQQCTANIPILTTHVVTASTSATSKPASLSSRSPWVLSGNITSDCVPEDKDVVFLVDSSSRDGEQNFRKVKDFIKQAIGTFDIGPNLTRVGLILFNKNATIAFPLDRYNASQDILNAVENIAYKPTDETNTGDALELVRKQGFTYDRPDVPNIAFLITDGYSSDKNSAIVQARLAKQNNTIQIIATAVGQFVDFNELVDIASNNPYTNQSLIYHVDDFDDLHIKSLENVFTSVICGFELSTLPPKESISTLFASVTPPCYDIVKNCDEYRKDMCSSYRPWAIRHCKKYCGFCHGATTAAKTCADQIGNCREYGPDICISTAFKKWTKDYCSNFCGLCGADTTTTPMTTKAAATPVTSTSINFNGMLATAPSFASTNTCTNKISTCGDFGQDVCTDYQSWARDHCQKYCGFCQGSSISPKPCADTVDNCNEYGPDICKPASFSKWTHDHCASFCNLCNTVNDSTTTIVSSTTP
ncbi:transmembrane matrix receptor MUP-4-like [Mercenaria mercenaria]|uniref:transmembrane matrix receptor MUP-4-like n=1 Tax=Mercenaria mercenaria TaxID=6596 RepID=UPI00234E449D|nr:transmembrane matrix receptor MUP-4-like [Mercenaria mercenaria]